ncbi:uncharacterized protein PG986_006881 [Apiospora aurea]|uniref:RING-CH-type domain-containing protein n=1 Tax=Apiospora aurea TaxID=335848 RepID=A0ABR1QBB9_9PEZI
MASSPSPISPAPGDATASDDTASASRVQGEPIASEEAAPAPQVPDNREISNAEPAATPSPAQDEPNDVHRCFICLEDEPPKDLPADWVTPCTCSLEGHQQCMLTWVADLEGQGKDIKCPVCQSPIQVLDKWDPAVQFSDEIMRTLSNMSPFALLSFLCGGALVSSAFYGMHALEIFAGSDAVKNALPALISQGEDATRPIGNGLSQEHSVNVLHFLSLSMIGPALILNRLYLGNFVIVPTSVVYAMFFVEHQSDLLAWPPGPRKAMAIFPTIKTLYLQAYWACAKMVDRRVEAALARNRSLQGETARPVAAPQPYNPHVPPEDNEADLIDLAIAEEEEEEEAGEPQHGPAEAQAQADRRANPNSSLSSVLNFFAGALLWPAVSYSAGNLLRMTLPKSWVTRPSTGPITEELSTDPIEG